MTMIGAERPDTNKVEVILGVDTHTSTSTWRWLWTIFWAEKPGRVEGVPTTAKGYKRLLCWAEGFGPVRCAGIEGASRATGLGSPAT
ncbi:MAG: hypothetical protein LC781_09220 [Actinobacteria bacterium]|nr:hypothetical protein [Actinomycetota bacterium]